MIGARPWQYARWLVRKAEFIAALETELKAQYLFAYALLKVLIDGQLALLHIELQSYEDSTMGWRMLEYSVLAEHQHKLPVCSFVIYLRKQSVARTPYVRRFLDGLIVHQFHFRVVKLWQVSAQSILDLEWDGLLPLLPLTKDGKKPEMVQVMIDQLVKCGDANLLALSEMVGGLAFTGETEKAWFKRRFAMFQDIMKDSWVYQEMLEQGREEGREQGREEARQTLRQAIAQVVRQRFPSLEAMALQQISRITDLHELNMLLVNAASAQEIEVFRRQLIEAARDNEKV